MIDWRHWHNEPYLVGGLVILGWLYALATGPFRSWLAPPGTPYPRRAAWAFYSALVIFYLAVGSPLDQAGERFLLSAHMVQHQLLLYPAAIYFIIGLPSWLVDGLLDRRGCRGLTRFLVHPLTAGIFYTVVLTGWHVPTLYDWALQNKTVHVIEHVMFFAVALLYWWPLLSRSRAFPPLNLGVQILYLIAVLIAMTPLFAFLAFSQSVLYPTYEFAPRLFDALDPKGDQLLGAAIMKLGSLAIVFLAVGVIFYRWYLASEPRRKSGARPSDGVPR